MSIAVVYTRAQLGLQAPRVAVETHLSNGLPAFNIVGLAQTAVKESKDRVRSALLNSHFDFPDTRITVNLAPADIPKHGGRYDLAIALGILLASGQLSGEGLNGAEFYAELGLNGELRPVNGLLPAMIKTVAADKSLFLPEDNSLEASIIEHAEAFACDHLLDLCAHLNGQQALLPVCRSELRRQLVQGDFAEVKGQGMAKRALEIAAAGGHNVLFTGPPGTGKTMLASRFPSILPDLSDAQALEVAAIHSLAGEQQQLLSRTPPFRAPHHSASAAALIGGGPLIRPGELSLAHHGVLFLDELPEFARNVIESLRQPLESGSVNLARARQQLSYPANFQLIAARNPCKCGYDGDAKVQCRCSPDQIANYQRKVSGPLLDRIDLHVRVERLSPRVLDGLSDEEESSATIARRVLTARQIQLQRAGRLNARLPAATLQQHCALGKPETALLHKAGDKMNLSPRAYHRTLKTARTIADLRGDERIEGRDIMEALAYREEE